MNHHGLYSSLCIYILILTLAFPCAVLAQGQSEQKSPIEIQIQKYPSNVVARQKAWVAATVTIAPGWHMPYMLRYPSCS